jgi:hypothetical protein
VTEALILDEHYSDAIAKELRERGHDVISVVANSELRGQSDSEIYRFGAENGRRVVTENIKDFRPLLVAGAAKSPSARLLLVPPSRFPRGGGDRQAKIVAALDQWLSLSDRPQEDWLQ